MPDFTPFIVSGLSTGAIYVLSGVGLVVLYRASGVLNFAQGAVGALGALLAWQIIAIGGPDWVGWIAGILAATLLSLFYGRVIAPRLAHNDPIVRAVATLGFALVVLGFLEFIWGEWPRSFRLPTDTMYVLIFGVRVTYTRGLAFAMSIVIVLAITLFLSKSRLGLSMRALANDRDVSALLGVPILRVDAWAWVISGAIAGLSGLMLANMVRLQGVSLTFMVIPAIAAAILGRLNSLTATVIGGLAIGVVEAMATPLPGISSYRSAVPFIFAMGALVWFQRGGLSLGRLDQFRSVRTPSEPPRTAFEEIRVGLVWAILIGVLVPMLASAYWLKTFTSVIVMGLSSLSVALLYAQLGMVSLCQYALFGVGGWVTLRLAHATGLPFELSLLSGGVVAAAFGVLFGLPALRMRGLYFALVTLMIAGAFQVIINAFGFPDGGDGFFGIVTSGARHYLPRPLLAQSDAAYFRYALAAVAIGFAVVMWHQRSRPGRAWALIRRSEAGAVAMGTNIVGYKVWAFALSGFLAGVAGGLMAGSIGQLDGRAFPASDSIMLFALTVIAGAYHWSGPLFAGLLMRAVPALLVNWHIDGNLATMVFGAGLLHALMTAPQGISGQMVDLSRKISGLLRGLMRAPQGVPAQIAELSRKISGVVPRLMGKKS
jgi:ABC-type branched-subunit amino acid transport system permease subunit